MAISLAIGLVSNFCLCVYKLMPVNISMDGKRVSRRGGCHAWNVHGVEPAET